MESVFLWVYARVNKSLETMLKNKWLHMYMTLETCYHAGNVSLMVSRIDHSPPPQRHPWCFQYISCHHVASQKKTFIEEQRTSCIRNSTSKSPLLNSQRQTHTYTHSEEKHTNTPPGVRPWGRDISESRDAAPAGSSAAWTELWRLGRRLERTTDTCLKHKAHKCKPLVRWHLPERPSVFLPDDRGVKEGDNCAPLCVNIYYRNWKNWTDCVCVCQSTVATFGCSHLGLPVVKRAERG